MELREFREFVKKLVLYHQPQRPPKIETINLWFEDLKHIASADIPAIYDVLKSSEYPYNLARAVLAVHNSSARNAGNGLWRPTDGDYRERDRFDAAKMCFESLSPDEQKRRMQDVLRQFNIHTHHMDSLKGIVRMMAIWNMADGRASRAGS